MLNLENIRLIENSPQTHIFVGFHLYEMSRIGKSLETKSRLVIGSGREQGKMQSDWLVGIGLPLGMMKMLLN